MPIHEKKQTFTLMQKHVKTRVLFTAKYSQATVAFVFSVPIVLLVIFVPRVLLHFSRCPIRIPL